MPASTFIALKPHRDIKSGRVLRPSDEITSEDDLIATFPGKFKLKVDTTPVAAAASPGSEAAAAPVSPVAETPAKTPAKALPKP